MIIRVDYTAHASGAQQNDRKTTRSHSLAEEMKQTATAHCIAIQRTNSELPTLTRSSQQSCCVLKQDIIIHGEIKEKSSEITMQRIHDTSATF